MLMFFPLLSVYRDALSPLFHCSSCGILSHNPTSSEITVYLAETSLPSWSFHTRLPSRCTENGQAVSSCLMLFLLQRIHPSRHCQAPGINTPLSHFSGVSRPAAPPPHFPLSLQVTCAVAVVPGILEQCPRCSALCLLFKNLPPPRVPPAGSYLWEILKSSAPKTQLCTGTAFCEHPEAPDRKPRSAGQPAGHSALQTTQATLGLPSPPSLGFHPL